MDWGQAWFILGQWNMSFIKEQSRLASCSTTLKEYFYVSGIFSCPSKLLSWLSLLHPSDLWASMPLLPKVRNYHLADNSCIWSRYFHYSLSAHWLFFFVAYIPVCNYFLYMFTYFSHLNVSSIRAGTNCIISQSNPNAWYLVINQ